MAGATGKRARPLADQRDMSENRVEGVERALEEALREMRPHARRLGPSEPLRAGSTLRAGRALALFEAQLESRAIDLEARRLRAEGTGYYTIQSAGHEQNAVLGALLRPSDPCLLHYRSGALMMARAQQEPAIDPVFDALLGICASSDDPIAQGRHKVFGSRRLWVIPQTSTVASQLPKAAGMAFAHERALRIGIQSALPRDAIVCCSFGDGSANHATALSGIHAARYAHRRGNGVPLLLVCEDNGLGISVETPRRWIKESFGALPHLSYLEARGDLVEIWQAAERAIELCRRARAPVFLHLHCVRLFGHAGSDVESGYRSLDEIRRSEARDPLLHNAQLLVECGAAAPEELLTLRERVRARVRDAGAKASARPKLASRAAVMAPLAPADPAACRADAERQAARELRERVFPQGLPERARAPARRTLAGCIQAALADELARRPELLVFGEDVGRKGGVYHVTAGLQERFGPQRVFDTLLDETTILGVAQGAALCGLLPVPEIQYLAYLHNAIDQLRGEASSLGFFSSGQFQNPMVVRIAGLAYQKGFGGHFHNDHAIGALREIPGLCIAVPARGDDAARLLRGALALARVGGRVVCFLEPIALYHEKDLYEPGDGLWLSDYPSPGSALLPGEVALYGDAGDGPPGLLIVSYGNGLRLSLRAQRTLAREQGLSAAVLDLRWLAPLALDAVHERARVCGRVLFVDECRASAGVADALIAGLCERGFPGPLGSVRAADSFVPLGPAAEHVLVSERDIVAAALRLSS
jgi:2-oxoisovalerate dehydrogenase E1 component